MRETLITATTRLTSFRLAQQERRGGVKIMVSHPYQGLHPDRYWRSGTVPLLAGNWRGLYVPRKALHEDTRVGSGGSCFAQHVSNALRRAGLNYFDAEPAPLGLPQAAHAAHGYGLYSARFGNVYSSRQLRVLVETACGLRESEAEVWTDGRRYYDAMRPAIEPDGFASKAEVIAMRVSHLRAVAELMRQTEVFIFTLGLTEVWINRGSGTAYPLCPGTVQGRYEPAHHALLNMGVEDVCSDIERVLALWQQVQPDIRLVLTVSPVPLAATATDQHVVVATARSKAVLRTAAAILVSAHQAIDYFPSYEIVTSPLHGDKAWAPGGRQVGDSAVAAVVDCFLHAHGRRDPGTLAAPPAAGAAAVNRDAFQAVEAACAEAALDRSEP